MAGEMEGGAAGAGAASSSRIARLAKGDKGRTMMHADVANEIIDTVNECAATAKVLKAAKVSPETAGQFIWADANMVLKLNPAALVQFALPVYPAADGTYVLGVVIASGLPLLQWLPTDTCE